MNAQALDTIIAVLNSEGNLTAMELLIECKEQVKMDTVEFSDAILRLEQMGVVRREGIVNKDRSGSIVYCLDKVRTESQKRSH